VEPEINHFIAITREQWYGYVNQQRLVENPPALTPSTNGKEVTHVDGPERPRHFWWNGKRYSINSGRAFDLLMFMWGKSSATFEELNGPGGAWDELSDANISTIVNRLNTNLPSDYARRLKVDRRCVVWK